MRHFFFGILCVLYGATPQLRAADTAAAGKPNIPFCPLHHTDKALMGVSQSFLQ